DRTGSSASARCGARPVARALPAAPPGAGWPPSRPLSPRGEGRTSSRRSSIELRKITVKSGRYARVVRTAPCAILDCDLGRFSLAPTEGLATNGTHPLLKRAAGTADALARGVD